MTMSGDEALPEGMAYEYKVRTLSQLFRSFKVAGYSSKEALQLMATAYDREESGQERYQESRVERGEDVP